jgi:predicted MFS family arabinose efflux permease
LLAGNSLWFVRLRWVMTSLLGLLAAAGILGVGFGCAQPALMALTTDRVAPEERGKAMGTFYFAWELGIASGAAASGWLLTVTGFGPLFTLGALIPCAGALLAFASRRPRGAPAA